MRQRLRVADISSGNRIGRTIWHVVWLLLYRPTPRVLHGWRAFLLRIFGARIGRSAHVYPSSRVWAPWNLAMGDHSTLAEGVDCYCIDRITIGNFSTVSQYSFLCGATHDYLDPTIMTTPHMPLLIGPITIEDHVWITSDVFVGPGVTIHEGSVILARSTVVSDIPAWTVAGGYPATPIRPRVLRKAGDRPSAP